MEAVHERLQIHREIAGMIARVGTARITMTPLRQGESVDGLGQIGKYGLEGSPGVREAVQDHYGNARRVSLLDVGESHPVGKLDGFDVGCRGAIDRLPPCDTDRSQLAASAGLFPVPPVLSYSSQASMLAWRTILPSCKSSVVAVSTLSPSGYSHASLNAIRFSPTISSST